MGGRLSLWEPAHLSASHILTPWTSPLCKEGPVQLGPHRAVVLRAVVDSHQDGLRGSSATRADAGTGHSCSKHQYPVTDQSPPFLLESCQVTKVVSFSGRDESCEARLAANWLGRDGESPWSPDLAWCSYPYSVLEATCVLAPGTGTCPLPSAQFKVFISRCVRQWYQSEA